MCHTDSRSLPTHVLPIMHWYNCPCASSCIIGNKNSDQPIFYGLTLSSQRVFGRLWDVDKGFMVCFSKKDRDTVGVLSSFEVLSSKQDRKPWENGNHH